MGGHTHHEEFWSLSEAYQHWQAAFEEYEIRLGLFLQFASIKYDFVTRKHILEMRFTK